MSFGIVKESASSGIPVFQKDIETVQGGFTLDETGFPAGTVIPKGSVMGYDESTRKAKVLKGAVLQASVTNTATAYPVLKGHNLLVGNTINLPGGTARAITTIDRTNPSFDTVNVGTTIGAAAAAGIDIAIADAGQTGSKGFLRNDILITAGVVRTLSIVIRGTVYERRIPPVSAAVKAQVPTMIFSQSY